MRSRLLLPGVVAMATLAGCAESRLTDPDLHNKPPEAVVVAEASRLLMVGTTTEIQNALLTALPGDTIVVVAGTYTGSTSTSGSSKAFFFSDRSGTAADRITLRSEFGPGASVLQGTSNSTGYVFYLTGDYWDVRGVTFRLGQKGIMLDNANNNLLYGCEVFDIGHEAIHLRDGSDNNTIDGCNIHDAGQVTPGWGEGVYVGSDKGKWEIYDRFADNNVLRNSTIGPGVRAEHVDIKEGTTGTIIEGNTFLGAGISGANYADSFLDAKGNAAVIRNNVGYRGNNGKVVDAFQVHRQVSGWGVNNQFRDNTVHLDIAKPYVVNVSSGSAVACGNVRDPKGNLYRGGVTVC